MNSLIIPSACMPVRPSNNRDFKQIACLTGVFFTLFLFYGSQSLRVTTARTEVETKPAKKPPATNKSLDGDLYYGSCGRGLLVRARQISALSKRRPNSGYGVSRSLALAVSKTQKSRNYWKTRSVTARLL